VAGEAGAAGIGLACIGLLPAIVVWGDVAPTPPRAEMRVVTGELVEPPRIVHAVRGGDFASVVVGTPSGLVHGVVRDIGRRGRLHADA
jgi:hypothetical protein